ncbi:uncharacterized protein PV07_08711 [Cladophialophora immunda]|uniref:Uncharacterized protein n=1 Tax=Cladophialophora immunda TaxID=569365 RepID=A0A0D2C534_9EURO|nr:uncharacterized protein PV07_08711 [Cladophialophora immunda]KIW25545.1 hypothetical protein PV07_08711 [Cladophialophora immunda]
MATPSDNDNEVDEEVPPNMDEDLEGGYGDIGIDDETAYSGTVTDDMDDMDDIDKASSEVSTVLLGDQQASSSQACSTWLQCQSHLHLHLQLFQPQITRRHNASKEFPHHAAGDDKVDLGFLTAATDSPTPTDKADKYLVAAILAQKRIVYTSSSDQLAQAVSWYNLG